MKKLIRIIVAVMVVLIVTSINTTAPSYQKVDEIRNEKLENKELKSYSFEFIGEGYYNYLTLMSAEFKVMEEEDGNLYVNVTIKEYGECRDFEANLVDIVDKEKTYEFDELTSQKIELDYELEDIQNSTSHYFAMEMDIDFIIPKQEEELGIVISLYSKQIDYAATQIKKEKISKYKIYTTQNQEEFEIVKNQEESYIKMYN